MTISAKLFIILTIGFRDVLSFLFRYKKETGHQDLVAIFF